MSFAETVLRAGLSLVGWLVAFVQVMILAVIPRTPCAQGAGDMLSGSLTMAVPVAVCLVVMGAGRRLSPLMRWASAPTMLFMPLALMTVVPLLGAGDVHLCEAMGLRDDLGPAPDWHRYWPWIQAALLTGILAQFALLLRAHWPGVSSSE